MTEFEKAGILTEFQAKTVIFQRDTEFPRKCSLSTAELDRRRERRERQPRTDPSAEREGADATLAFAVSLSRAASGPVTVDYATADGTAEATFTLGLSNATGARIGALTL